MTDQLLHRICSEFDEMPGLQLTFAQAQRLWGLDEDVCARALQVLLQAKILRRTPRNTYARAADGAVRFPELRMAKAQLRASEQLKQAV